LAQLSSALPYDLKETDLRCYNNLPERWKNFDKVREILVNIAVDIEI
jgi:hypothetical protein